MRFIPRDEAKYLATILASDASADIKENALEHLCALYRQGAFLKEVQPIKHALMGLLGLAVDQPKVMRWTLTAIGEVFRRRGQCFVDNISGILERFARDDEILCAGVAALFSVEPNEEKILEILNKHGIPLTGPIAVAASPYSQYCQKSVESTQININTASGLTLQRASLLIGTKQAPEHFFEPRHTNQIILGKLNAHNNPLVAQYSIWALAEHPEFGLADLGIDVRDIASMASNVRRWLYQLITKDKENAEKHRDLIVQGTVDPSLSVREGLARGLQKIYFLGIERIVMEWYGHETSMEIKLLLNEHMAVNFERSNAYESAVAQVYFDEPAESPTRLRLQAAVPNTNLYTKLMQIAAAQTLRIPLFELGATIQNGGPIIMVEQKVTQTITNNGTIGAINATGDNTLEDFIISQTANDGLEEVLLKLVKELKSSGLTADQQKEVNELIKAAASKPSPFSLEALIGWAEKAHLAVWLKQELLPYITSAASVAAGSGVFG